MYKSISNNKPHKKIIEPTYNVPHKSHTNEFDAQRLAEQFSHQLLLEQY